MSFLQQRRDESSQDINGISFSDLRSTNISYKPVTRGFEELDLGDENSSLRPIIDRKLTPSPEPSPTFEPIDPANGGFLSGTAPRPLPQKRVWRMAVCLLLGLLSVPFYVFCGFAWHYHGRPVESKDQSGMLNSFGNKLATAFPFVFSLVVGHTVRQVGAWKLERGTTLGSLEQIMGSLALGSTIMTQMLLRRPNILALLLLATWALSPIGSQSSLQILRVGVYPTISQFAVPYFNCDAQPGFAEVDFWNGPSLNALFSSSLMAPASIRNSSMDLWRNVKIPDISRLTVPANSSGWTNVSEANVTYSSVLGIPLSNIPRRGNTTFLIESSYIALDCYDNITATTEFYNYTGLGEDQFKKLENGTLANNTFYATIGPSAWEPINSSTLFPSNFQRTFALAINGFYWGTFGSVTEFINVTSTYEPRTLLYQSKYGGVSAWCPITTKYVESAVECAGADCSVVAIRPSELKHPNTNLTNLGFISTFDIFCTYLMRASSAELHDGTSSALELYIGDPDSAPHAGLISPNITGISASDLGIRLQQVLNTYWFGSYDPFLNLNVSDDSRTSNLTLNTTATNIVLNEVFVLHFGWFFALLLATSTILGAALVGAFFSWRIMGPDILGHCSTLLRDTPYTSAVKAGTTMDGLERTRRERTMRVKLLDVDPNNEVGYVAIAENVRGSGGELVRGRYYR